MTKKDSKLDEELPLGRSPGPSWQDLLETDSRAVPDYLRAESPYLNGLDDIPKSRYLSRDWHELEKERLWSRVWQFACREEHLPHVGSYIVYDIADQSYLVVRVSDTEIKAYPNACLHRGRLLKTYDGRCSEFRCPFHGFTWRLDGELKQIPAEWDFPQAAERDLSLPEVKVGCWAGFVFINPDTDCEPLEEFLGPDIQQHFERWDFDNRYLAAHVPTKPSLRAIMLVPRTRRLSPTRATPRVRLIFGAILQENCLLKVSPTLCLTTPLQKKKCCAMRWMFVLANHCPCPLSRVIRYVAYYRQLVVKGFVKVLAIESMKSPMPSFWMPGITWCSPTFIRGAPLIELFTGFDLTVMIMKPAFLKLCT